MDINDYKAKFYHKSYPEKFDILFRNEDVVLVKIINHPWMKDFSYEIVHNSDYEKFLFSQEKLKDVCMDYFMDKIKACKIDGDVKND